MMLQRNDSATGVGPYRSRWRRSLRYVAQRVVLRSLLTAYTRTTVEGIDNVAGVTGPFVLVANHSSHLDTVVILSRLPHHVTRHLAVGAAADHFYQSRWSRISTSMCFNTYPVHRISGGRRPEKGLSARLLTNGVPLLLYPEGTRSRDGVMGAFRLGAANLCVSAGVPCIPVALVGSGAAMPVGRSWPVPGRPRVQLVIGEPVTPRPGEDPTVFNLRITAAVSVMRERPTARMRVAQIPARTTSPRRVQVEAV